MDEFYVLFPNGEVFNQEGKRIETGSISDGYHTFNELYDHRCLLFIALMQAYPEISWKSRKHSDGTFYDGWFITGMELSVGQITYHLPNKFWAITSVRELNKAPKFDGHTSKDVISRLEGFIKQQLTNKKRSLNYDKS